MLGIPDDLTIEDVERIERQLFNELSRCFVEKDLPVDLMRRRVALAAVGAMPIRLRAKPRTSEGTES